MKTSANQILVEYTERTAHELGQNDLNMNKKEKTARGDSNSEARFNVQMFNEKLTRKGIRRL